MRSVFNAILPVSAALIGVMFLPQCKQPYISPYTSPKTGYLVVEGYISGNTLTSFRLSRTIKLSSDTTNPQEPGATVQVEGTDNSVYPLIDEGGGVYNTADTLPLTTTAKYRLRIQTQSGGEYLSDYAPYKVTPAIDSINWIQNPDGVTVYANTHDDAGNTRYYQWSYDEVWEYHSGEQSGYEYQPLDTTVTFRSLADQIYRCWQSGSSTALLIGSTAKLSKDLVYEQPLRQIAANSVTLGVLYSILVRQYALTDSGYNYLSLMQKNTESLGTIFDAQPSELKGNIHSLTNSNEPVIGFVSAGTVQQQRIFIDHSQLQNWVYSFRCPSPDTSLSPAKADLIENFASERYTPIAYDEMAREYISNFTDCINCTQQGGTTTEPSFWPN